MLPPRSRSSTLLTLTAEPGVIGGIPAGGLSFGAAVQCPGDHRSAQPVRFLRWRWHRYRLPGPGPGRPEGNLNVSKFGPRLAGAGGFIDISQNAKKVVFVGTFTAGKLQVMVEDGKLRILEDGKAKKFVAAVEHRTFSGEQAVKWDKTVLYITERCVFRLCAEGLELIEIAPGVDLQKDILDRMDFTPVMRGAPALMEARIFSDDPMKLRQELLAMPMSERLSYDADKNLFFHRLFRLERAQRSGDRADSASGRQAVGAARSQGQAIVNYDRFSILPELVDDYIAMVKDLMDRHYHDVTRYTSSTFLRMKLAEEFEKRQCQRMSSPVRPRHMGISVRHESVRLAS
jgi:propionate CoA-transferase